MPDGPASDPDFNPYDGIQWIPFDKPKVTESANLPATANGFRYGEYLLRHVIIDGEPWFVVSDLAIMLGYRDAANAARVLRSQQVTTPQTSSSGLRRDATLCNEAGVWRLIMRSNKPEAEAIQDWITDTVLPEIRRTGSYGLQPAIPQDYANALRAAADAWEAKEAAELAKAEADQRILELEPSAHSYEALVEATGDYSVGEVAQILRRDPAIKSIGRTRLFTYLKDLKWIYRSQGGWAAYQNAIESGWLARRAYDPAETNGVMRNYAPQIRITAKGMRELHRRLGGGAELSVS